MGFTHENSSLCQASCYVTNFEYTTYRHGYYSYSSSIVPQYSISKRYQNQKMYYFFVYVVFNLYQENYTKLYLFITYACIPIHHIKLLHVNA